MNVLPMLLIGLLLSGDKFASIKQLLQKIDFPSFAPVFQMLGVDKKTIDYLSSEEFSNTLSNGVDLKSLIPLFSSFISQPQKEETTSSTDLKPCDYLAPIKEVAPTDVGATIERFLS